MDNIALYMPKNLENMQLPDPELLTYYRNLEKRIMWLEDEVDGQTLDFVKKIIEWNQEDKDIPVDQRKPIKLFFFSPGGELDVNNALIDTITMSKTPIIGINVGQCYSAAAYIFLSCHVRYALPRAQLMLHQGSGGFQGSYQEVVPQVMAYQEQIEKLASFVAERTDYTQDEVMENITSDWYINPTEGLEKKVYTEIISDMSIFF